MSPQDSFSLYLSPNELMLKEAGDVYIVHDFSLPLYFDYVATRETFESKTTVHSK